MSIFEDMFKMDFDNLFQDLFKGGLSSFVSGGIGDLFGDSNAKDAHNRNKDLMHLQTTLNRNEYAQRYQYTTKDMIKAGLNPILAATGGFSVGNSPQTSLPSTSMAPMPNTGDVSNSARNFKETKAIEEQTKNTVRQRDVIIASANKIRQETNKVLADTARARAEAGYISQNERKLVQEISNLQKQIILMTEQIYRTQSEKQLIEQQHLTEKEKQSLTRELKREAKGRRMKLVREIAMIEAGLQQLFDTAEVYRSPVGQIISYIKEIRESLGISVNAGAHGTGSLIKMLK